MGRPLAKRFFSGGTGVTIGCTVHDGGGVIESAIISQKSNSKYRVAGAGGTPITGTTLVFADANPDTIADSGASWADFTLSFSAGDSVRVASSENSGENDGVYEIATVTADLITLTDNGVLVANAADTTATLALVAPSGVIATLVQGVPNAAGEMQVTVTPEIVGATAEATLEIDTDGAGLVSVVTLLTGGNGYFTAGNFLITNSTLTGNGDARIDFTVANGAMATAVVGVAGTGYTINQSGVSVNTADITDPATVGPDESAKIINARTVKTFEGNIYQWPAAGGAGTPKERLEADLQTSDL